MTHITQCLNRKFYIFVLGALIFFFLIVIRGELNKPAFFYSNGLFAFGKGVTSTALQIGQEENIFFDKRTKARIFLSQDDIDENKNRWIVGNIDFVISSPVHGQPKVKKRDMEHTVLRIKFDLRYQIDTLEISFFDVYSDASITDVAIQEQVCYPTEQKYITYGVPLEGEYHVVFWNKTWGCAAKYNWHYKVTLHANGEALLAVQQSDVV